MSFFTNPLAYSINYFIKYYFFLVRFLILKIIRNTLYFQESGNNIFSGSTKSVHQNFSLKSVTHRSVSSGLLGSATQRKSQTGILRLRASHIACHWRRYGAICLRSSGFDELAPQQQIALSRTYTNIPAAITRPSNEAKQSHH